MKAENLELICTIKRLDCFHNGHPDHSRDGRLRHRLLLQLDVDLTTEERRALNELNDQTLPIVLIKAVR